MPDGLTEIEQDDFLDVVVTDNLGTVIARWEGCEDTTLTEDLE